MTQEVAEVTAFFADVGPVPDASLQKRFEASCCSIATSLLHAEIEL